MDTGKLMAEFIALNNQAKQSPLTGVDLSRWQYLKSTLITAQNSEETNGRELRVREKDLAGA